MSNESSPLLPRHGQSEQRDSENHVQVRTGVWVADTYNNEDLIRNRARLSSWAVINVPEKFQKYEDDDETEQTDDSGREDEDVDPTPDSKYKNISTGRFWLVFLTIMTGHMVATFDISLMASIHPVITSTFNASNEASWLTTAFMITNTGFQALWGRLSDTIGRKLIYLILLTLFALTNLWCGLATTIGSFIAARAVCGIAGGGLISMGVVITNDLVKLEYRGTFISNLNIAFAIGAGSGAAFGGIISDSLGWRWCFYIQVPVLLAATAVGTFTIPSGLGPVLMSKGGAWKAMRNFDHLGVITILGASTAWVLFFNMGGNEFPWNHPVIITCLVIGVVLSALLIWIERRAKQPVMPLHLLVTPPYMNLTYANFLSSVASNAVLFNAPLWFQAVEQKSPSASGLRLVAPALGAGIAGILTGNIMTWTQRLKPMMLVGATCYLAGSIAIFFIDRNMSEAEKIAIITPAPLSQGFIYPGSMICAFASSRQEDQGVVTTTLTLWRNLGIVVGVAVSSLVFQNMLNVELKKNVHGSESQRIIEIARGSVKAIGSLPDKYKEQVLESYAGALRWSFVTAIVASGILLLLMLPMRLPRLNKGPGAAAGAAE